VKVILELEPIELKVLKSLLGIVIKNERAALVPENPLKAIARDSIIIVGERVLTQLTNQPTKSP
jgi:hypothetical protein